MVINILKNKSKEVLKRVKPPGFEGLSLFDITTLFSRGIKNGTLITRASAISFKFFLALFPGIIFIFSILPNLPVPDFQETLLVLLNDITPDNVYPAIKQTINDIISRQQHGLLSVGFLMALFFSSAGFMSIIQSFNQSYHINETRTPLQQRIISITLVIITTFIIVLAIVLIVVGRKTINWLLVESYIKDQAGIQIYLFGRWIILATMIFFSVSFIYYLAPAKKTRYRFFSAGSILATLFIIIISGGFRFFIMYFSRYNALYGSVGTIMIILLFIYFNAIILLSGFELNATILAGRKNLKSKV